MEYSGQTLLVLIIDQHLKPPQRSREIYYVVPDVVKSSREPPIRASLKSASVFTDQGSYVLESIIQVVCVAILLSQDLLSQGIR
jgi:hypothetical protein